MKDKHIGPGLQIRGARPYSLAVHAGVIVFLLISLLSSPAWAVPQKWGLFVPTGVQYLGSRDAAMGIDWGWGDCNGYDRSGINHINWSQCIDLCMWCPGYMCSGGSAFDIYQAIGDFYDCDGNLLEQDSAWGYPYAILKGTGTIFDGGIGGIGAPGGPTPIVCYVSGCSPALSCRVYSDTSPQINGGYYCPSYPDILSPYPDRNLGRPRGCHMERGNPVNVATGNKYEEVLDLTISTPGIPLEFLRFYNSQSDYEGPLGYGWTHNYNLRLQEIEETPLRRIILWDEDGRALYFHRVRKEAGSDDQPFVGESGVKDRLWEIASTGEYLFRRKDNNLSYLFSSEGKLVEISDPNGNRLNLTYLGGILRQVSNNYGKTLSFQYNSQGLVQSVKDPKNQPITYQYSNGDLIKVTYPDRNSVSYTYENHNLTGKYDTEENLIGYWEYDQRGRVKTYYSHLKDDVPLCHNE